MGILQKLKLALTLLAFVAVFFNAPMVSAATPKCLPSNLNCNPGSSSSSGTCQGVQCSIENGINAAAGNGLSPNQAANQLNNTIASVINVFSIIIGIIAVIMLIIAGFKYVTSAGSSDKIASAKSTVIYAIVGLIIVALAQTIVKFVAHKITR